MDQIKWATTENTQLNIFTRIEQLKADSEKAAKQLATAQHVAQDMADTIKRIEGAIQVLNEMLPQEPSSNGQ